MNAIVVYWICLVLGAILVLIGLICLFASKSDLFRKTLSSAFLGIGATLVVGTYVQGALSDQMVQQIVERSPKNLAELPEPEAVIALSRSAGHPNIAQVVKRSILDSGLYRKGFEYDATLVNAEDATTCAYLSTDSVRARSYYKVHAIMKYTLVNPTVQTVNITVQAQNFFLNAPPGSRAISYERYEFNRADTGGVTLPGYPVVLSRERLQQDVSSGEQPEKLQAKLRQLAVVGPSESATVMLETCSWESKEYGQLAVLDVVKTIDKMDVLVRFPADSIEHLERDVQHVYSRCIDGNDVCTGGDPAPRDPIIRASIHGGILPFNGIIVSWKSTGPPS